MASAPQSFSGPLKRKVSFLGFWSTCFCEIHSSNLEIKRSDTATKVERRIRLTRDTQIMPIENSETNFQIITPDKQKIIFMAASDTNRMEWILALRAAAFECVSLSIDNFDIISVIGRGYYGKVMLCENKETKKLFAIKTVHKDLLMKDRKVHTIIDERNILTDVEHPFIVSLRFAFQSTTKFYLGLEYLAGGELFRHFRDKTKIEVQQVKLYVVQIALALNYLHENGIIYRDLKPENILLADDGYIKLTDFGLSKKIECKTETFCGTPEYVAPEVIRREPYGFAVDWWSLGILTYELIFGVTPFVDKNKAKMLSDITNQNPMFSADADPIVVKFISGLLMKDPKKRYGFDQIKNDPFFSGISFQDVLEKRIEMKYVPVINDARDAQNFDEEFTAEPTMDSVGTPPFENVDFDGFSFTGTPSASSAIREDDSEYAATVPSSLETSFDGA